MVESLQSLLWSGAKPDYESFQYMTEQACLSRNMPVPKIEFDHFEAMANALLSLNNQWKSLDKGQQISVEF